MIFSAHHGVLDGWSGPVLLGSLHRGYQALMNGLLPQREPDTAWLEFGRHIASQTRSADAYWQGRGELLAKPNDLACLFGVTLDAGSSGRHTQQRPAVCATSLPAEVATLLAHRVRDLGVTAGLLAQYAWHRLLARRSGDAVTLVGNVTPGRDYPIEGITASVGLYINSLPLALAWRTELTLAEHIARLQTDLMALNEHGTQSLAALTKGRARLFQSLFVFENYPMPAAPAAPNLTSWCRALAPWWRRWSFLCRSWSAAGARRSSCASSSTASRSPRPGPRRCWLTGWPSSTGWRRRI